MKAMKHYSRRNFMKTLGLGAAALAVPQVVRGAVRPEAKPNILYILADDMGYGDVHCLNPDHGKIPTPHIDRLSKQGITFTDAHSGSSVCTPTRYGILTGRYAFRSRLQSYVLEAPVEPLIAEGRLTVAELLRRHGYHTAAIGKWHLGYTYDRLSKYVTGGTEDFSAGVPIGTRVVGGPTSRGFDTFFGFHHARAIRSLVEGDRVIEEIEPVQMLPRIVQKAVETIGTQAAESKKGKPFFMYLALSAPHGPIVPARQWQGKSGLGPYGDFVMQVDDVVGQVLTVLDKTGVADNTLVIMTSDNGCAAVAADAPSLVKQGHYPSADLRGYKSDIWEGGHRIPFIARWPGKIKAGASSGEVICLTDLMATCAALVDEKLPDDAGEDSYNMLPILLGKQGERPLREATVHHSINGKFAIRQGPWKLEFCPGSGGWSEPRDAEAKATGLPDIQLYNMTRDKGERRNEAAEQPETVKRLTRLMEKYLAEGRSTVGAPQKNDVPIDLWKRAN